MIYDWVKELVSNYSFIEKATIEKSYLFLYYKKEEVLFYKKISIRANRDQLIKLINKIKIDINYEDIKKERDIKIKESIKKDRDKPLIFAN